MTLTEITNAILSSELTAFELSKINEVLKFKREQITLLNKQAFRAGQKIEVRSPRTNFKGTIQKINKKNAVVVSEAGSLYTVPMELIYAQ